MLKTDLSKWNYLDKFKSDVERIVRTKNVTVFYLANEDVTLHIEWIYDGKKYHYGHKLNPYAYLMIFDDSYDIYTFFLRDLEGHVQKLFPKKWMVSTLRPREKPDTIICYSLSETVMEFTERVRKIKCPMLKSEEANPAMFIDGTIVKFHEVRVGELIK